MMTITSRKPQVNGVVSGILNELSNKIDTPSGKATLAKLRNSIGKETGSSMDAWEEVIKRIPASFLSVNGIPTKEENAIMVTLQMFAIHQRGKELRVDASDSDDFKYTNIGGSLRVLRSSMNAEAIDRRFNAMISTESFQEITVHLRQLITLLVAKHKDSKINYALLANDLFWYQAGKDEQVRFAWAQSFYRQ